MVRTITIFGLVMALIGCEPKTTPKAAANVVATKAAAVSPVQRPAKTLPGLVAQLNDSPFHRPFYQAATALSDDGAWLALAVGARIDLINTSTGQQVNSFQGHTDVVGFLLFDGGRLHSGDVQGDIRTWDLATGEALVYDVAHAQPIAQLGAAGGRVISGDTTGNVRFWTDGQVASRPSNEEQTGDGVTLSRKIGRLMLDEAGLAVSGFPNRFYDADGTLLFHDKLDGSALDIGANNDDWVLLTGGNRDEIAERVHVHRLPKSGPGPNTQAAAVELEIGDVYVFDMSSNGQVLVTANLATGRVEVYDTKTGERRWSKQVFTLKQGVEDILVSADGSTAVIISGYRFNTLDLHKGTLQRNTLSAAPRPMHTGVFVGTDQVWVSNAEQTYRWNMAEQQPTAMGLGASTLWHDEGRLLGVNSSLWALDPLTGATQWELAAEPGQWLGGTTTLHPDGRVVLGGSERMQWVDRQGKRQGAFLSDESVRDLVLSPDGTKAAIISDSQKVVDLRTASQVGTLAGEPSRLVAWTQAGIVGFVRSELAVWPDNGGAPKLIGAFGEEVSLSASGRQLASINVGLTFVDLDKQGMWQGEEPAVFVHLSADGQRLLAGLQDGRVVVLNTADLPLSSLPPPAEPAVSTGTAGPRPVEVEYSDDVRAGTVLVNRGSRHLTLTVGNGESVSFEPHNGSYVDVVELSSDGSLLVTGGTDGLLRLWSTASGQPELRRTVRVGEALKRATIVDQHVVFVGRREGARPVIGACDLEGKLLWRMDKLRYGVSDTVVFKDGMAALLGEDMFTFVDVKTGAILGRRTHQEHWVDVAQWTDQLTTWSQDDGFVWDTSWLR